MAKKVEIEIDVNSQQVVQATQNVNGLNQSIQDTSTTTKEFGSKIKIEYDKAGKATDVLVNSELTLKKQIRAVYDQMQLLTAGGKAQSQEFTILQRKYNDLNDNLGKNKLRSQELFGTLSMLPGPVGAFAQQMQGAVDLLKTFSGYKLSDISNQVTALGDDLKEIVKGFLGIGAAKAAASGGTVAATTVGTTAGGAVIGAVEAGTAATVASTIAVKTNTVAVEENLIANRVNAMSKKEFALAGQIVAESLGAENAVLRNNIISFTLADKSVKQMTIAEVQAAAAAQTLAVAETEAAVATDTLTTSVVTFETIATAGVFLLIAAAVAAIGAVIYKILPSLLNYTRETKENISATDAFTEALKREKLALDDDLTAIDTYLKINQTRAKIQGKSDAEIAKMAIAAGKEKLEALRALDNQLYKEQQELNKRKDLTTEQSTKLNDDLNKRSLESNRAIIKQITDNEQIELDARLANTQLYYQKRLAEIDAAIQLEIDKDVTSGKRLGDLQVERQNMVIAHDKLGVKQKELLRAQDKKKNEDAVKEDQQRVETYLDKIGLITLESIKDLQTKEIGLREQKFEQDKRNLIRDKEFQKSSKEEQNRLLLELEETKEVDLVKIRETYFLKKLQQYDEQKTLEIQKKALQHQNLLKADELELKEDKDHYQLLHFNLKEYYNQRMVDMRLANQIEHDNTNFQLQNELLQLKMAYDNKNITDEAYAAKKNEINKRIGDNDQQLVDKQIALDQVLLNAKKETAAATMSIAENLVGLLSSLGEFSTDWQITAAIAEAGLGIAKIIISTQVAIAEFSASVAALGPIGAAMATAYAIKEKIAAGIGIAAITVGAIGRINAIKGQKNAAGGAGGGAQKGMGKNYGDGGMIDGPRHAGGGVAINAEGGEAIMTRGAVTMFAPLLSMMNQAGGGTSFSKGAVGQANFDNPKTLNGQMEQPIIKTYVVENELTSIQHRTARLKDLSTL